MANILLFSIVNIDYPKMQIVEAQLYKEDIITLLTTQNQPVDDLPLVLDDFFVVLEDDTVMGLIGMEIYGEYGLLRSLAVDGRSRGKGIASALINHIETLAHEKGLRGIFLLTDTATEYFANKGYVQIARMDIPDDIKNSSQFTGVCPDTAIAMEKPLNY